MSPVVGTERRGGSRPQWRTLRDRTALVLVAFFVIWLFVGGGASRADVQSLIFVRVAALLVLPLGFLYRDERNWRPLRPVLIFAILCLAAVAVQLVPLPPALWGALPGHQMAQEAVAAVGLGPSWRPLSVTPDRTLNALVSLFPPAAALIVVGLMGAERHRLVLSFVLAAIAASALLGALQVAGGPDSPLRLYEVTNEDSAVGLFSNRNHQALFLACGFPLAAWWIGRNSRLAGNALARWAAIGAAFIFLILMVLTTGSRGGLMFSLAAMVMSGVLLVPLRPAPPWPALAGAAVALPSLGAWLGFQRFETINRLLASSSGNELRWELLGDYWNLFAAYFPAGSGYGSFQDVYRVIERVETLSPSYLNNAHNDLAQLGIEGGLPGLLLLALAVAWLAPRLLRVILPASGRARAEAVQLGRAAAIVILLLLIGSVLDYPLRTPLLSSLFVACCVILTYCVARERGRSRERSAVPTP